MMMSGDMDRLRTSDGGMQAGARTGMHGAGGMAEGGLRAHIRPSEWIQ